MTTTVYRVGDPDPTPAVAYPECGAKDGDYTCTWAEGHAHPQHVAGTSLDVAHVWPVVAATAAPQASTPDAAAAKLLAEYDAWRAERADLSLLEDQGAADSDDWHDSDDAGCDLAARLADALRAATGQTPADA